MTAARELTPVSVVEYLADELVSDVKHEYLGGIVHAMAGARNRHSRMAGNAYVSFANRLRGGSCRPWNSNTKIRIPLPTHTRFYYPDASVVCQPNPDGDSYQEHPVVIVEVLSRSTRRTDEIEKRDACQTIPSLCVYLLVEQESPSVLVYRRTEAGFVSEYYTELSEVVPLPEIGIELPLEELYADVTFGPEPDDPLR